MDILHRRIITVDQRLYLKDKLSFSSELIYDLIQHNLLFHDDREVLQNPTMSKAKKFDYFIDCLEKRGPDAFNVFCTCLAYNKLPWIAARLKTVEASKLLPGKSSPEREEVVYKAYVTDFLEKCRERFRSKMEDVEKDVAKDFLDIIHHMKSDCSRILPASEPYRVILDKESFVIHEEDGKINQLRVSNENARLCLDRAKEHIRAIKNHVTTQTAWPKTLKVLVSAIIENCSDLPKLFGFNKVVLSILTDIKELVTWIEKMWITPSDKVIVSKSPVAKTDSEAQTHIDEMDKGIQVTLSSGCQCRQTQTSQSKGQLLRPSASTPAEVLFVPVAPPKTPAARYSSMGGGELELINEFIVERGCTLQSISLLTPEGTFLTSTKPAVQAVPPTPIPQNVSPVGGTHSRGVQGPSGPSGSYSGVSQSPRQHHEKQSSSDQRKLETNQVQDFSGYITQQRSRIPQTYGGGTTSPQQQRRRSVITTRSFTDEKEVIKWRVAAKGKSNNVTLDSNAALGLSGFSQTPRSKLPIGISGRTTRSLGKQATPQYKQATRFKTPKAFDLDLTDPALASGVRDRSTSPKGLPDINTNQTKTGTGNAGSPGKPMIGSRIRTKPKVKPQFPSVSQSKNEPNFSKSRPRQSWKAGSSLPSFKP